MCLYLNLLTSYKHFKQFQNGIRFKFVTLNILKTIIITKNYKKQKSFLFLNNFFCKLKDNYIPFPTTTRVIIKNVSFQIVVTFQRKFIFCCDIKSDKKITHFDIYYLKFIFRSFLGNRFYLLLLQIIII